MPKSWVWPDPNAGLYNERTKPKPKPVYPEKEVDTTAPQQEHKKEESQTMEIKHIQGILEYTRAASEVEKSAEAPPFKGEASHLNEAVVEAQALHLKAKKDKAVEGFLSLMKDADTTTDVRLRVYRTARTRLEVTRTNLKNLGRAKAYFEETGNGVPLAMEIRVVSTSVLLREGWTQEEIDTLSKIPEGWEPAQPLPGKKKKKSK